MEIQPAFNIFSVNHQSGKNQVVWITLPADMETAISAMFKLTQNKKHSFLLESVTGGAQRGRYSVIGCKPDIIWKCRGNTAEVNEKARAFPDVFQDDSKLPLESLRYLIGKSQIDLPVELPSMASGIFGYLGYDMVRLVEHLPMINEDTLNLEDAILVRPTLIAIMDHARDTITLVTSVWNTVENKDARRAYADACEKLHDAISDLEGPLPQIDERRTMPSTEKMSSNFTHEEYKSVVQKAQEYIKAGDIFQVVPSQRWKVPFSLSSFSLYRALRRTNPSPYMTYFNFGHFQIVGASPEILVSLKDKQVTIRPIAGTRPRGDTVEQDEKHAQDLLNDPKELAEHLMLLDLGRNDVGRVSQLNSVYPTEQFTIERYSHVMHIVSNVVGTIKPEHDALSALLAGMPAGTVSGAPKVRAMEIIDILEPHKRGIYGGAVGYFSANGDMDTCIALRTSIVKDGYVYVQSGGGIVYDSDPEAEYQETVNKAKAITNAINEAEKFGNSQIRKRNI